MTKVFIFSLLILIALNVSGQGRRIDGQIVTITPKLGENIISRKNGSFMAKFFLKNNGPDTIKPGDNYEIKITFSNINYNPFKGNFSKVLKPQEIDTVNFPLKMTWDTDVSNINFCAFLTLFASVEDSIRKETGSLALNNKSCVIVNHISKLNIASSIPENIIIYPNPSTGTLILKNIRDYGSNIEMRIFNQAGQEVKEFNTQTLINSDFLDLSDLKKGLYYIEFKSSIGIYKGKLLIIA